ncbi:MAG: energy transducer TonB [Chitinophagales bacterium]|nr:energy transducer TonB [Chitinophagales bacterium]
MKTLGVLLIILFSAHYICAQTELQQDEDVIELTPPPKPRIEEPEVFTIVEEMPRFKGCDSVPNNEVIFCTQKNLMEYVNAEVKKLNGSIIGKVFVYFIVDEAGEVTSVEVRKGADNNYLNEAALKIINSLPDFIPGKQRGKPVKVSFVVPVNFNNQTPTPTTPDVKKEEPVVPPFSAVTKEEPEIFTIVEEMPRFKGCEDVPKDDISDCTNEKITKYVETEENKLKLSNTGRVYVGFIIDESGKVTNIEVKKGVDEELDEAAINIIKSLPNFIPAKTRGEPRKVSYVIPVNFK